MSINHDYYLYGGPKRAARARTFGYLIAGTLLGAAAGYAVQMAFPLEWRLQAHEGAVWLGAFLGIAVGALIDWMAGNYQTR